MLTISSRALSVIRRVTGHQRLDQDSGVRIAATDPSGETLEVGAVNHPSEGDQVVEREGARLYVDPDAVDRIDGGELDAREKEGDRVQFVLRT